MAPNVKMRFIFITSQAVFPANGYIISLMTGNEAAKDNRKEVFGGFAPKPLTFDAKNGTL